MALEYDPAAGLTKFMIGTEQGSVLSCNRKAKNPADRVGASYPGHHGPVYGLKRNPFYPKYFLSLGDWTARVWNEDLKVPLMTTQYDCANIMGGTWSPTRPAVFFTMKADGHLDVWDLFYKCNGPTLNVSSELKCCLDAFLFHLVHIADFLKPSETGTIVGFCDRTQIMCDPLW